MLVPEYGWQKTGGYEGKVEMYMYVSAWMQKLNAGGWTMLELREYCIGWHLAWILEQAIMEHLAGLHSHNTKQLPCLR